MDPLAIAIIALLLFLNAIFVAAEFAIVGAPQMALEKAASEGSAAAARVVSVLRNPQGQDRYIATAQLGITIASLGLGMYGEKTLADWLMVELGAAGAPGWLASHAIAGTISIILLSYLHIVLGEMVPKGIALARADRAAQWLTPFMLVVQTMFFPLVAVLNGAGNLILRLFGIERRFGTHSYTPEELQEIVREAQRGGTLQREAASFLDELIEFSELTAREVMVPRVHLRGIEVGASIGDLETAVSEAPHARYPVYAHDLDHIVGMVHIKDIARRLREGRSIAQADIRRIPFVPGSTTLDTVLRQMRDARVQMAVVMDEHGGTDGVLTTEDLFEEVVGDITDAPSDEPPEIYTGPGGRMHLAGTVRIEELGEELDRDLEHEEVDTVSGLILDLLDRPPAVGDRVVWENLEFEVTEVEGHGVAECAVRAVEPPEPAPTQP
jgi:CBS domain containing-hemolysin-like protein